jgi:hypothetical protein
MKESGLLDETNILCPSLLSTEQKWQFSLQSSGSGKEIIETKGERASIRDGSKEEVNNHLPLLALLQI